MSFLTEPWFWAAAAMLSGYGATFVVSGHPLGRNLLLTAFSLIALTAGRLPMVLRFCPQPRFDLSIGNWSIGWGSVYGLALTPIWWIGCLLHVLTEEKQLEEKLGSQYADYKKRVRGRLLPGLPI